jgi:hypothetical protein
VEWIATEYQQEKSLTGNTGAPCREEKTASSFTVQANFLAARRMPSINSEMDC